MLKESILEILLEGKNDSGTCYVDAVHYMQGNLSPKLKLVHGLVDGQGPLVGITYNHAWVEDGNTVIDASLKEQGRSTYKFPKDLYYGVGNIKTTFRYNHKEMAKMLLETEIFGPWEKVLIKNKY